MSNFYNKNLYKMLGVTSDATPTEIKVAYRTLVRKLHPDVSSDPQDTEKFKELKDVYEILIDPEKRKKYDILYSYYLSKNYHNKTEEPHITPETPSEPQKEEKMKEEEIKQADIPDEDDAPEVPKKKKSKKKEEDFTSKFSNVMNTLFSSDDKKEEKVSSSAEETLDIYMDISVTVNEAIEGTSRIVNILHSAPCPNCGGKKFVNGASCIMCQGTGEISIYKKLNVKIPAGIMNGSKIRVKGEGNSSPDGSEDGDLYLNVIVQHSDMFKYDNLNILCDVPITPYEAVLGATVEIPTPQGIFKMKVPPMTNSGQKFRISGEGLVDKETNNKGDVIATVTIKIPPTYSNDEIKHYKQLKKLSAYNVREVSENE
ncbi:DnaJ domain-containing protein [bacterium]|nr:DnaJ domain-containing protein [bacterium]